MEVVLKWKIGEEDYFPAGTWLKAFKEDGFLWVISSKNEKLKKRAAWVNVKEIRK